MRLGIAHVAGKYTYPAGSGTQVSDGGSAIRTAGYPTVKFYCGVGYATDYQLETWSSSPTTCTAVAQTTEMAAELGRAWHTVILTCFTFANGATNWWRVQPTSAKMAAEYTELYNLVVHLRNTYNGTGRRFVIQQWEGDWAYMDASGAPETYVAREIADRYVAFLGTRRRAIHDAVAATASDCQVLFAVEVNRVAEARTKPHMRRILRDVIQRVQPDVISYSAYDTTTPDGIGYGASYAAWEAAVIPMFAKALRQIQLACPGVPIQIGEFGFPEGAELPEGRSVADHINAVHAVALAAGVVDFIYWQWADNEETSPGVPRGYWIIKPDGTASGAGTAMAALL